MDTSERILISATSAFGENGYDSTSLDSLADDLGIRKQSILYHFSTKEILLHASVANALGELREVLSEAIRASEDGWDRIETIVRGVFRLAIQRPELLGLLREVSRLGPPVLTKAVEGLEPLIEGAREQHALPVDLVTVDNDFFGHGITVSGLLTGIDIAGALRDGPWDLALVPPNCINGDGVTLDDMTLSQLSGAAGLPVAVGGYDLMESLIRGLTASTDELADRGQARQLSELGFYVGRRESASETS